MWTKEQEREYFHQRYMANREKFIAKAKVWAENNRERRREISNRYSTSPKGRARKRLYDQTYWKTRKKQVYAKNLVHYHLRKGTLIRGVCEVCGDKKTHAHHTDYDKPLEVRWLCLIHHSHEHNKLLDKA